MKKRFILLPQRGVRSDGTSAELLARTFDLAHASQPLTFEGVAEQPFKILDSVMGETSPKLVELETETALQINQSPVPLRAVPEVIYPHPSPFASMIVHRPATPASAPSPFVVQCLSAATGAPVAGAEVYAFSNFAARFGASGRTDAGGYVTLVIDGAMVERLFVLPGISDWGAYRESVSLPTPGPMVVRIEALDPHYADSIRQTYTNRRFVSGAGVRVGVLDTGTGPHMDLHLVGGRCTVTGEPAHAFADIDIHGTHVAGLIGGNGATGAATLGLAPGVNITPYRVFDFYNGRLGASNYAILKAMILAANDGCDIINLSLGGGPYDPIVAEAIRDGREQGMAIVVAAGNDARSSVSYPAAHSGATAVSAMGRDNGFPKGSYFDGDIERPPHGTPANPEDFIASFSNVGPQIACTGLGCGVLSTLPGNRFGPLSGTSMAAPMVAGAAASLLSQQPAVRTMPRNLARSDAIVNLLQSNCLRRFGGGIWEGYGLPDPAVV